MKTGQKFFIVLAALLIMSVQLTAQESKTDFNRLKIGNIYKVSINNGWRTEGKLTKLDSNSVCIVSEYKAFTINKNEIEQIVDGSSDFEEYNNPEPTQVSNNYKSKVKKDKLFFSVGTGVNFTSVGFSDGYNPGINFQLDITKIISDHYAIRGDLQFGQNKKKGYESSYEGNYSKSEGGDINNYSLKFDFLLGALKPSSKINAYGILGGGLNFVHESDRRTTGSYQDYNYYTNEYITETYSYTSKGSSLGEIVLEFGGGFGYKISDRVRLFGEAQYNFPILFLSQYIGFYPESFLYGNPSLKIGAQIGL